MKHKDESKNWSWNARWISLAPAVDAGYFIRFGKSGIGLFPHVGLTSRINLFGQKKVHIENQDFSFGLYEGKSYKRFQLGWEWGVDLYVSRFSAGLSFGKDILPFSDNKSNAGEHPDGTNVPHVISRNIGIIDMKLAWHF